jgi:hypothetical protein
VGAGLDMAGDDEGISAGAGEDEGGAGEDEAEVNVEYVNQFIESIGEKLPISQDEHGAVAGVAEEIVDLIVKKEVETPGIIMTGFNYICDTFKSFLPSYLLKRATTGTGRGKMNRMNKFIFLDGNIKIFILNILLCIHDFAKDNMELPRLYEQFHILKTKRDKIAHKITEIENKMKGQTAKTQKVQKPKFESSKKTNDVRLTTLANKLEKLQASSDSIKQEYIALQSSLQTRKKEVLREIISITHNTFNPLHHSSFDDTSFDPMGRVDESSGGRRRRRTLRRVSRKRRHSIKKNITRRRRPPVRRFYSNNNNNNNTVRRLRR